jgi:uncharacterized Zn finger protein
METEGYSRAVRVDGEVVVLHCWACGTAHCVNLELCAPEQIPHMVCSSDRCKMSMFLVNELDIEDDTLKERTRTELITRLAVYSRFWK